ncbi:MAG: PmoA family protein, partial [Tannerella sp.]|nr:PmoA family protein [Tannerella sp.]
DYTLPKGKRPTVTSVVDKSLCISQMDNGILYWRIDGRMDADATKQFVIDLADDATSPTTVMGIKEAAKNLIVTDNGKNVFQYNIAMPRLPAGVGREFARNGFIHPAWSPAGNQLTNAMTDDHAHHFGIWNPWTHVDYDGKHYDLWNLGDKTGTVLLDTLYSTRQGDLFADITVGHAHLIFQPQAEQTINTVESIIKITPKKRIKIMDETLSMRVWNVNPDKEGFLWDFISDLKPATDLPVLLTAYRYAGFGWRATADWTKENCVMVTSEGKQRPEIDGTNARWIYVTGASPKGRSGILFMGYPENRKFPEPLRIWDQNQNGGRGDAFVNFAPTKNEDWTLEPHKTYRLRYRMLMFDGDITPTQAEDIWQDFAKPVKVSF